MAKNILKNTTLGMIVANEEFNCSGGILSTVRNHMPHYERGVIVHTGSKDGTGNVLKKLQREFSSLKVVEDHDSFKRSLWSGARNVVLEQIKTERVAFFDADEAIKEKDYETLANFVNSNDSWGFNFRCIRVLPDGEEIEQTPPQIQNPRIFKMTKDPSYGLVELDMTEGLFAKVNRKYVIAQYHKGIFGRKLCALSPVPFYHFKWYKLGERTNKPSQLKVHLCRNKYN